VKICQLLLSILLGIVSLYSMASVGTVTEQTAAPGSIVRTGKTVPAAKGAGIEMNDSVNTTKGKVGITFQDDTKVEVNENSKLVIDDFVYDPKQGTGKLAMKFASGTVRYASGAIAHNNPNAVALNTPSATVAVRGTDFSATVDEAGASTIILLPSCPKNWVDIDRDCKTGAIEVMNEAGSVLLNKPFQGTKVESRNTPPMKPAILNLSLDTINNLLIVDVPKQIDRNKIEQQQAQAREAGNMLDQNFLKQNFLENEFDKEGPVWSNPLEQPLLQQYFLENIFNILADQLQQETAALLQNVLAPQNQLLPDYIKSSGVTVQQDPTMVELCRPDGGNNMECVKTPHDQNSTVYMTQGAVTIKNRINQGNGTIITLKQN